MDSNIPVQSNQPENSDSKPTNEMPTKSGKSKSILVIFLALIILIVIGAIGYYLGSIKKTAPKETGSPTAVSTPTITPSNAPTSSSALPSSIKDTGIANQKKYTSPKLGISFIFPSRYNENNIGVKEEGNKIYVYFEGTAITSGQYVEVFQKKAEDTLDVAIQKQLLVNISPKDCFVEDIQLGPSSKLPANYQIKTLGYPVDSNSDVPAFAQSNKCPTPYAKSNGLSYFLEDPNHPKIFLFFSIGQYGIIDTTTDKSWQDTIEFLD